MTLLENIGVFLRPPDFRSRRRVEDEIAEELEFHLAMRAHANEEAGMSPEAARAAAEERFGDMESIRGACARIQMGEWRVLQRIQVGLMVVLLGAVVYFGWQFATSRAETAEMVEDLRGDIGALASAVRAAEGGAASVGAASFVDTDGDGLPDTRVVGAPSERESAAGTAASVPPVDAWLARFSAAMRWSEVKAIGDEIAALDPEQGLALMRELYPRLPTAFARQQILKSFVFHGGHPLAVEVLHLAATDPELAVQGWAFGYLKDYAFEDFSDDYEGYLAWRARYGELPVAQVLERNAQELAARLAVLGGEELEAELRAIEDLALDKGPNAGVDLAQVLRDAGLLDTLRAVIAGSDEESRKIAVDWLTQVRPDEAWLRLEVVPLLRADGGQGSGLTSGACDALAAAGGPWAVEPVLESLRWARPDENGYVFHHAQALAKLGDPRVIPQLIALIEADEGYNTTYGIGYYALEPLTGVRYDEAHGAAFWREWWAQNRHRLAPEVRELEIPELSFHQ